MLDKHNKIVKSTDFNSPVKNDTAALLIEDQITQEYSRFQTLKVKIAENLGKMLSPPGEWPGAAKACPRRPFGPNLEKLVFRGHLGRGHLGRGHLVCRI